MSLPLREDPVARVLEVTRAARGFTFGWEWPPILTGSRQTPAPATQCGSSGASDMPEHGLPCDYQPKRGKDNHAAARSDHPGGVNVAFVDGHVNFFQDTIDLQFWRALSTYRRGEVLSE